MTAIKNKLLRSFHAACHKANMTADEKSLLVSSFNVTSSADLSSEQLKYILRILEKDANPEGDQWRKRVIASVGAWLRNCSIDHDIDTIKSIACKASGYSRFNQIPVSRLRSIYYEFLNKQKTTTGAQAVKADITKYLTTCN
ncbi:hypothetical protein BZG01_00040 [Labilibaculum manganireducens]|uniref:DUF1018 domain-containing protein n=1 Tax=Labilibaculum manganireducens TaxID=1940525 RepID=A0A2N3IG95_9BACT|nr:hypothetical protein [Labilibaculum manganireducens]PKQ69362.1 hypothetical protein BZG01_00040 [Labilibaculum manganireducens]